MDDLKLLTDEELETNLNLILNEKERRERLKNVPAQIQVLASQFKAGGGDPAELTAAIQ